MKKKYAIYFFSGTGNSWWVAKTLEKRLSEKGGLVTCSTIENTNLEEINKTIENCHELIIGFPVYASYAPIPMIDFIKKLPKGNKKKVHIFATQALVSGDTAYEVGQLLVKKDYRLCHLKHFRMMNNLHLPIFRFYKPKNGKPANKLLKKTIPKVYKFADDIQTKFKYNHNISFLGKYLGNLQRKHIDVLTAMPNKIISIDESRCIKCGKCERICPSKNIVIKDNGYSFNGNCVFCLRCYSQCPKYAILFGNSSKNVKAFPRYKGPKGLTMKNLTGNTK